MKCRNHTLTFEQPVVMGIINVTPDSFSDGGVHFKHADAISSAEKMCEAGAGIIDVGGESTCPYSPRATLQEELDRVLPVIEALKNSDTIISVDTSRPEVVQEAVSVGAHIWNDVRGLRHPGAVELLSKTDIGVIVMHMQGEPETMQNAPHYDDVVEDIFDYLLQRVQACEAGGVDRKRICIDPGIGFGKTTDHCIHLLNGVKSFKRLGLPVAIGTSRKTFLGKITDREPIDRLGPSIASAVIAAMNGADIIRVHDVKETVDALKILEVVNG